MNWFFSVIKVCLLTFPVPSTSSLVTDESQLAGACCHILSAPVGVVDPTSPTEVSIGQLVLALLWTVLVPSSLAWFQRKSMISGLQWRYMSQPAVEAALPVLIRVWLVPLIYACKILSPLIIVTFSWAKKCVTILVSVSFGSLTDFASKVKI